MVDKKDVLMAVCNYFDPDNRVFRAADTIQGMGYYVTVLAYHKNGLSREETKGKNGFKLLRISLSSFVPIFRRFDNFQKQKAFQRKAKKIAESLKPSIVHCHDYNTLFLGIFCKKKFNSKLVYDCHEYFQDLSYLHRYPLIIRRKIASFERKAIRKFVDEMIVVSPGIAGAYQILFEKQIYIVRNIPDISGFTGRNTKIPAEVVHFLETQRKAGRRLLLYLGTNTQKGRGMDFTYKLICALPDDYGLVIFGAKNEDELLYLSKKASSEGISKRFGAFEALPLENLFEISDHFYMGLSLIEPVYFSYLHSLPNKLFEYLAMGLPVISSEIADQAQLVVENNIGLVIPFEIPKAKEIILESKSRLFNQSIRSLFTWESEKRSLLSVYNS
jgi:glycosyltransferase involved in cell wall biosynthesis